MIGETRVLVMSSVILPTVLLLGSWLEEKEHGVKMIK